MGRNLLPTTPEEWGIIHQLAEKEGSDGCTCVPDIQVDCCYLHDHFYRTGVHWKDGTPVSRREADAALRQCYKQRGLPILGFGRWLGVRILGVLKHYGGPKK